MNEHEQKEPDARAVHPIGVVARRTGLSLHVLRAWERRYGAVDPVRTEGGQRLYSDADVERLRLLRRLTEGGRTISQLAPLASEALAELAGMDAAESRGVEGRELLAEAAEARLEAAREQCLSAGERMDGRAVSGALMRAAVAMRPLEFLDGVLLPLMVEVGERWHAGELGEAQEHLISESARGVLWWMIDAHTQPATGPMLVATTPAGEQHELGAMVVSVLALTAGWRVTYLGPSLPAGEIVRTAWRLDASAVALSVVNDELIDRAAREIGALSEALPAGTRLLVGGRVAAAGEQRLTQAGARVITSMGTLHDLLHSPERLRARVDA